MHFIVNALNVVDQPSLVSNTALASFFAINFHIHLLTTHKNTLTVISNNYNIRSKKVLGSFMGVCPPTLSPAACSLRK